MYQLAQIILGIQTAFAQSTAADTKDISSPASILTYVLEKIPLWITAIIVFIISLVVGVIVKNIVESRLASKISEEHQEVLIISGRVAFVSVAIIGTTISLAIAGINITTLLAAVGFGISFGLQDTIANFVAGIAILASRPFTIGDWIKINGNTGKVTEIRARATYLKTYDGLRLIVPNSQLYKSQVLSYTSNSIRRIKVPVYCRYLINMKDLKTICMKVLGSNPQILMEPKPNVVFVDFADYYISLQVRFWVDSKSLWRRIQSEAFIKIQKALEEAGMDAPYPITALSFDQDIESAVLKTKSLDGDEFGKLMNARMEDEAKFTKHREEMLKKQEVRVTPETVDQSGTSFLKGTIVTTTMPLQTVEPLQATVPVEAALAEAPTTAPDQVPNNPPNQ